MAEIEVTEAMTEAGIEAIESSPNPFTRDWVPAVYRAMCVLDPARRPDAPDSIRHTAMEYAVRCTPSRADLVPLAQAIEAYLRGEGEPKPPVSLLELAERALQRKAERDEAMSPPLPAA